MSASEPSAARAIAPERLKRETLTLGKAVVSSAVATAVDGVVYQAALFLAPGHWSAAALAAALAGAVTNFTLNRTWAFPPSGKSVTREAGYYALASAATYVGMVIALKCSMDLLHLGDRLSWAPAKVVSWLLVSYPLQRWFVFSRR